MKTAFPRRVSGFTLLEVMVTVAIIAILAAVAVPIYRDYVLRGHIPQATGNLSEQRVKLEQFYQDNRKYTGACDDGAPAQPPQGLSDFTFSCAIGADGNSYTLKATGKGVMAGFVYELDQNNKRSTTGLPTGWGNTNDKCWVTAKGGAC